MVESTTPGSGRNGEPVLPTRRSRREAHVQLSAPATPSAPSVIPARPVADAQSFPRLAAFGAPTAPVTTPAPGSRRAARLQAAPTAATVTVPAARTTEPAATQATRTTEPAATPMPAAPAAHITEPAAAVSEPAQPVTTPIAVVATESTESAEPTVPTVASFTELPSAPATATIPVAAAPSTPHIARAGRGHRAARTAAPAPRATQTPAPRVRRSLSRTLFAALIVPALFGTAALPAFASSDQAQAITDGTSYYTASELIRGDAQTVTVSAQADADLVSRDGYSASHSGTESIAGTALQGYSAPSDLGWWRPTDGPITSPYGPRGLICNGVGCSNSFHEGIDFGNACGTPIKATASGRVTFVGNAGAYGNRVIIDHGNGVSTVYGHILSGSFEVAVGDEVDGGVVIASVGATGVVSGCHLDLKVEVDGEMTDPAAYLTMMGVPKVIFGS